MSVEDKNITIELKVTINGLNYYRAQKVNAFLDKKELPEKIKADFENLRDRLLKVINREEGIVKTDEKPNIVTIPKSE